MKKITDKIIKKFKEYLIDEEKSKATIEKYIRDLSVFVCWLGDAELSKTKVLGYKEYIISKYAPASVNSILSSLNSFFDFTCEYGLKVKNLKIQKQIFAKNEKELTKAEYGRLLTAAKAEGNQKLYLLMQTICATGIRVSELKYITVAGCELDKIAVLRYKEHLKMNYAPASVNSVLSSLNSFFEYNEWHCLKVKMLKIQKQIFAEKNKELTKAEYERLLTAAKDKKNERLYYLMQTICSSGIRVSELSAITIEAVKARKANINCKGKMRVVILPKDLCKLLLEYAKGQKITSGPVFVTRTGKPLDRSTIWKMMKALCESAGVDRDKVFPHNLRHLFARTYYSIQKDIVRLADILGHSSVNTTRIYTMETGDVHRRQIQKLGLLRL